MRRSGTAQLIPVVALLAALSLLRLAAAPGPQLRVFQQFDAFQSTTNADGRRLTSPVIDAGFAWDELVLSWNVAAPVALRAEARAVWPDRTSRWYVMGRWCAATNTAPRTSVRGQDDADAAVDTDTLVLRNPAPQVQLRFIFTGEADAPAALRLVAVSLADHRATNTAVAPHHAAWGRTLEVPIRSQADYPEGVQAWCSPVSTTMLLAWWGRQLGRPELDRDVRDTVSGVYDPGWPGTGNWSFNMAHAGAQPGMAACVARFASLTDLEHWIAQGLPVAASVSYAQVRGQARPEPGDGHLVVVAGFTAEGDVVVNDPGVRRERVRRVFPRADFDRGWAHSGRTVYLVWPATMALPPGGDGRW